MPFGVERVTLANLGIPRIDTYTYLSSKYLSFFIRIQANERPPILHAIKMLKVIVLSGHPEEVKNVNLNSPSKGLFMREIMLRS